MFGREIHEFQVLRLPSWFPGMSFKRDMAVAREFSKQHLDRPFQHALQKAVIVILVINSCMR